MFLVKYYMNDSAVGLYGLAVSVVEKIWLLPQAIGLVLFSKVSNLTEESKRSYPCSLPFQFSIVLVYWHQFIGICKYAYTFSLW